jgi:UDP-sugar transporter A1/2/3
MLAAELPSPPLLLGSQPSVDETTERHSMLSVASAAQPPSQDGQPSSSTSGGVPWKGWAALGVFTLQNSLSALYGQFVLQNRPRCNARVLVLVQELAIKLPMSLLLYAVEQGGVLRMLRCVVAELRERPRVWARMGFPAVCYTVGAILQMVGGANLDASMGQVTFQSKIIFTAACSVALLGTRLGRAQLVAIFILTAGVVLADVGPALLHSGAASHSTPKPTLHPMHPRLGVAAWLGAALCSAFASVYFEKMVKQRSPGDEPAPSLWLRNIQLCSLSCLTAVVLVAAEWREGSTLRTHGPMHNFDHFAWLFILLGGSGGIVVALVIKHADNIRRGFAAGLALILTSLGEPKPYL